MHIWLGMLLRGAAEILSGRTLSSKFRKLTLGAAPRSLLIVEGRADIGKPVTACHAEKHF